jgi:hypothetical protein
MELGYKMIKLNKNKDKIKKIKKYIENSFIVHRNKKKLNSSSRLVNAL